MTIGFVQSAGTGGSAYTTTVPVTLAAAATVGNTLLAAVGTNGTATTVSSISGGGVGTWAKSVGSTAQNGDAEIWQGVVTTAGATSVSITLSNGSNAGVATIAEFSGASTTTPVRTTGSTSGTSSVPKMPGVAVNAGEMAFGLVCANAAEASAPSGWTTIPRPTGATYSYPTAYQAQSASGTTSGNWPTSASKWSSVLAVLQAAPTTTVPGAPTNVSAVAGSGSATVYFNPPASNGGAPITSYTITSSPGGLTAVVNV